MPLMWPFRNGGVNVVVHQWDSLSTQNMFGENKIIGFNVPSLNGVQTEPCKKNLQGVEEQP